MLSGENVFIRVNVAPRVERDERGVTLINIYLSTTLHYRDALYIYISPECASLSELFDTVGKEEIKKFLSL